MRIPLRLLRALRSTRSVSGKPWVEGAFCGSVRLCRAWKLSRVLEVAFGSGEGCWGFGYRV